MLPRRAGGRESRRAQAEGLGPAAPPGAQSAGRSVTGRQDDKPAIPERNMHMASLKQGRPTTYNGIRMRSRLEADYAGYLDRRGITWEYEPECFASPAGQWLPDFHVSWRNGGETFIELKPAGRLKDDWMGSGGQSIDGHLTRMTVAWASRPDVQLVLVYWQYGGSAVMEIESSSQGAPWIAKGGLYPLLWTGMGQYIRCSGGVSGAS